MFLIRLAIDPWFPPDIPYALGMFFPAVMVSAYLFGTGPGVFAGLLCGYFAWYYFLPPHGSVRLADGAAVALTFYGVVVAVDLVLVHLLQIANIRLRDNHEQSLRLAEERGEMARRAEVLFHELQHRVGNNLQMIGAVLGLQEVSATDPAARNALANAGRKLELIGRIQRRLYSAGDEHLTLDNYLRDLVNDLIDASGNQAVICRFTMDPDVNVPVDNAIALALIVAEAVVNAIEHGFKGTQRGQIDIDLSRQCGQIEVRVRDDGVGLPADFDLWSGTSRGTEILRTLAGQMGAEIEIANASPGTAVTLRMPDALANRSLREALAA